MNVVIVRGRLSSPPRHTELGSEDVLVRYEVTVARADGPAESVPVAWVGPAEQVVAGLEAGEEVVAVGRVRRRFWAGPTGPRSATEVVAEQLLRGDDRRRILAALRRIQGRLAPG